MYVLCVCFVVADQFSLGTLSGLLEPQCWAITSRYHIVLHYDIIVGIETVDKKSSTYHPHLRVYKVRLFSIFTDLQWGKKCEGKIKVCQSIGLYA